MPTADVSARPAILGDQEKFADIQLAAWRAILGDDVVDQLPRDEVRDTWGAAIEQPPSRTHRTFAATDGPHVVGFAAVSGGEIVALEVATEYRRLGHGSRLLAACVDTLRAAGTAQVRAWAVHGDDAREQFLRTAGFALGGVSRTLDTPGQALTERLWRSEL